MERIQNEQPHGDGKNALKKIDPSKTFVVLFKVLLFDHKTKNVRAHRSFCFYLDVRVRGHSRFLRRRCDFVDLHLLF
jgi:hypothetical protein